MPLSWDWNHWGREEEKPQIWKPTGTSGAGLNQFNPLAVGIEWRIKANANLQRATLLTSLRKGELKWPTSVSRLNPTQTFSVDECKMLTSVECSCHWLTGGTGTRLEELAKRKKATNKQINLDLYFFKTINFKKKKPKHHKSIHPSDALKLEWWRYLILWRLPLSIISMLSSCSERQQQLSVTVPQPNWPLTSDRNWAETSQ